MTAVIGAITACNHPTANHDADVKSLQDNKTQWNQDFLSKDAEKLVAHYADDTMLISPEMPATFW
jgi:ketosteroid isomerase-like protein